MLLTAEELLISVLRESGLDIVTGDPCQETASGFPLQ